MKTFRFALALATAAAAAGLAAPSAEAAATSSAIQTLNTPALTADQFNSLFQPYNTAVLSPFRFDGATSDSGLIESQVFKGTGAAAGLYAYAYQVAAAATSDGSGDPVHVDSTAFKFNATPVGTDFTNSGTKAFGYVIPNGQVGGLDLAGSQTPSSLSWQAGASSGFIRAQYVDPATQTGAVGAGTNSATFVLLSTQLPSDTKPSVNIGGASATTTVPVAYSASGGTIEPVPVPEPATLFAWAGMACAAGLVRHVRKARAAAPLAS